MATANAKIGGTITAGLNPARETEAVRTSAKESIAPQSSTSGIQSTFDNVGRSASMLGALGASIASDLSNQRAQQVGMEQARLNPGLEPLPAFTQADKHFVDAYRQEEFNNNAYHGQQFLQKAAEPVLQDPTPGNLIAYQQNSQKSIQDLLENTTEHNRANMERTLQGAYQSHFMQLSKTVEARNKEIMTDNFRNASDQNNESIYTYGYQKDYDALNHTIANEKQNIQQALHNRVIDEHTAQAKLKTLKIQEGIAHNISNLREAESAGAGDAFLYNFAKSEQPNYSPLEKEAIGVELYKHLNSQRALTHGQQQINFTNAMTAVELGQLTPSSMEEFRTQLSGEQFARVEQAYAKQSLDTLNQQHLVQDMSSQFGNVAQMASYTDGQFSKVFSYMSSLQAQQFQEEHGQEQPFPLISEAVLAQNIKRDNPIVSKKLSQAINYGGAQQATEAAQALRMLTNNNPIAIQGLDSQTKMVADLFNLHSMDRTREPEEALKDARAEVYDVDDGVRVERVQRLSEFRKLKGLSDYSSTIHEIKKSLSEKGVLWGRKDTVMPEGIVTDFNKLWANYMAMGGDPNVSKQAALDELSRIYTPTHINGRSEIMFMAPESIFTDTGDFVEKSRNTALTRLIDSSQQKKSKKEFSFNDLEWANPEKTEVKIDGIQRKVYVDSDALTHLGGTSNPSWLFYYLDDSGNKHPLMDPDRGGAVARWQPDTAQLREANELRKEALLKQAKHLRSLKLNQDTEESLTRTLTHDIY